MPTANKTLTATYQLVIPAASTSFLAVIRGPSAAEAVTTAADATAPNEATVGYPLAEGGMGLTRALLPTGAVWMRNLPGSLHGGCVVAYDAS